MNARAMLVTSPGVATAGISSKPQRKYNTLTVALQIAATVFYLSGRQLATNRSSLDDRQYRKISSRMGKASIVFCGFVVAKESNRNEYRFSGKPFTGA